MPDRQKARRKGKALPHYQAAKLRIPCRDRERNLVKPGATSMLLVRAIIIWLVIMGVEFTHGALRTVLLTPHIGDFRARQISVFTGSLLIVCLAYLFIKWLHAETKAGLILVGLLWLALTVGFELGFGRYVFGRPWGDLASDYNLLKGGLLPLGLAVLAFSPWIAARLRGVHELK